MDEKSLQEMIDREITQTVETALGGLPAAMVTEARLRAVIRPAMQRVRSNSENYALMSLLTADDVAAMLGVSVRRVRAIARNRHERFGVGWQVPGTSQWLFRPSEIEALRPDEKYKKNR